MRIRESFDRSRIALELKSENRDDVLGELVALLALGEPAASRILAAIVDRESIGSTGIGERVAIPHCRTNDVDRLHIAYGRKNSGIEFAAIDGLPARHFFLIVAPHGDAGGAYLTTLAQVAQLCKRTGVLARLETLATADEFLALLEERNPV
ncbi:MAG: PTS sugar transporter subunit IIA [bacterium]